MANKTHHKHSHSESAEISHGKKKNNMGWLWPLICIVLVALLVASIITSGFGGSASGKSLSKTEIQSKTTAYLEKLMAAQGSAQKVIVEVANETNGLYELEISVGGQKFASYVSKDGTLLFPSGIDMTQKIPDQTNTDTQAQNVPKTDKPKVELFVMAYCPYGTQIEKGIIPVMKLLKGKADIEVKFVNYAMHGEKEVTEQLTQVCINSVYPEKYVNYLECFLNASDSTGCMAKYQITESGLSSCKADMEKQYKIMELYNDPAKTEWMGSFPPFNVYDSDNEKYGVQGSPTLVINGVQADSARDAQSLLYVICSAFNNAPSECSTDMTSYGNPAPGFGWNNQGASASTGGGCGG